MLLAGDIDGAAFTAAVARATPDELRAAIALGASTDPDVRLNVAMQLPFLTTEGPPLAEAVEAAVALSADRDPRVRDWACTALGEQWREVDTPELRDALAARLDDADDDARCGALVGLAYRRDDRARPAVRAALTRPDGHAWRLELVAAAALGDPELHPLVVRHQDGWSDDAGARSAATALRLTDPGGPGDDMFEGVAELSRRRARGAPDGDALSWWSVMSDLLDVATWRSREFLDEVVRRLGDDAGAVREIEERSALSVLASDEA